MFRKGHDSLIGEIKLFEFVRGSKAEFAYWVNEGQRRQGLALEAAKSVLAFAFGTLGLHRVEAYVQPTNEASLGFVEKLGFKREGHLRRFRKEGEDWRDFLVFGLLREDTPSIPIDG